MNNLLNISKAIAVATILMGTYRNTAQAQTETQLLQQIEQYSQQDRQNNVEQVTNVNQLKDVAPTDWSYDAIRSLSERYGCISGFPDGTYRGDRPITRYEFAAGLNSCFEQIERSVNNKFEQTTNESSENEIASFAAKIEELKQQLSELKR